jgi:hypothetical protein
MSKRHYTYHVFKDNELIGSFTLEPMSFAYLRDRAKIHSKSDFRVERAVTIFDSFTSPEDKTILEGLRSIER